MTTSEKIIMKRKEKNLTLQQVGDYCGVSRSTVQKWESGNIGSMRSNKIKKLAECLGVDIMWLIGYDEWVSEEEEVDQLLDSLRYREEGRMLFKTLKGATKDDILTAVSIIDALKKKNNNG